METVKEPTTIGLTVETHNKLQKLKEDGFFGEMADAYRLAIALAIAHNAEPPELAKTRKTIFNVGTLDPERTLYHAVSAFRSGGNEAVYVTAEQLAEWGVEELSNRAERGDISFSDIFSELEELDLENVNVD